MKCKYCEDGGELFVPGRIIKCPYCQSITNDEWRKICSAEEFAAWLWKHFDHGEVIVLWEKYGSPMYKNDNGVSRADYTEAMKRWLKEVHE